MTAAVLAVNPGSRSLKAAVHDAAGQRLLDVHVTRPVDDARTAVAELADRVAAEGIELVAVAHRVVHGGPDHVRPALVDDELLASLRALAPFAPLHLPGDVAEIEAARAQWPGLPQVACFDTAFHADLPEEARRLPLPAEVDALGVRRYGFHGLNLQHVVDTVPELGRAVVAHLGGGCSVTAVAEGRSLATTMSFSPTGGIPSASRSGDLDPDALLFLADRGWSVEQLRDLVDHRSGLAGIAGSTDVREITARAEDGDADSRLALDVLSRSVAVAVAGCTAVLGGLDTLVFTGGVGEHSATVRAAVAARLAHLGVVLDAAASAPGDLSGAGATVRTLVVPADEEIVLDRQARRVLRDLSR
ncbi:acetate/propionate family kinase [Modestobacter sp. VKM Ac-2985]|uniref:acetate/propionate family kinase n=1 Tax=Modestobacter sp. VKM Ac-2985 TaxID=3004139 RepID=UPI003FA556B7